MAAFEERTVTTVRHEYAIPNDSANWAEVSKAMSAADQAIRSQSKPGVSVVPGDDTIWVEGNDMEVVVWWEEVQK
jgi:hypothetical protein